MLAGPLPAVASESIAKPSEPRQRHGWAYRFTAKQRRQLLQLERISDRLHSRLLDLDFDADESDARARSNAHASSSGGRRSLRAASPIPPSPEVLVALLRRAEAKRALLQELDVQSPRAVASRLLLLSSRLDLPAERLLAMTRKCGRLLARRPEELQEGMEALADCMERMLAAAAAAVAGAGSLRERKADGSSTAGRPGWAQQQQQPQPQQQRSGPAGGGVRAEAEARAHEMAVVAPELLLLAPDRLRRSGLELGAVCKARGIKVLPMLSRRPDLLRQSASSLAAKMDVLPEALGLTPKRLREVLAACPDLLRRSPHELSRRYQLLQGLFGVPPAFMAELIVQEPRVLGFGADTLKAKFEGLTGRYGRFQDDVADMILVDPAVLINAVPLTKGSGRGAAAASRRGPVGADGLRFGGSPNASIGSGSFSSMDDGDDSGSGSDSGGGGGGGAVPVLDQVLQLSVASNIPVHAILQLVVLDERVCGYSRDDMAAQLAALGAVLGLTEAEVRSRVSDHPGLMLLGPDQLSNRLESATRLLQPHPDGTTAAAAAAPASSFSAKGGGSSAWGGAAALLRRHPELLLQDPEEMSSRLADLSELLLGPEAATAVLSEPNAPHPAALPLPPRLLALVTAHPGLLAAPPHEAANKLLVLQSMFEIPRPLVLELIFREPGLLAVSVADLERKFRALAASFGAFSADAIDVVLADPSLILRADVDPAAAREQGAEGPERGAGSGAKTGPRARLGARSGPGSVPGPRSGSPVADAAARSGRRRQRGQAPLAAQQQQQQQEEPSTRGQQGGAGAGGVDARARPELQEQQKRGGAAGRAGQGQVPVGAADGRRGAGAESSGAAERQSVPGGSGVGSGAAGLPRGSERAGQADGGAAAGLIGPAGEWLGGGGGAASSSGGGVGPKGDMGLLATMSAADFDKLGEEGLPPPPPPSARHRRRQPPQ